VLDGAVARGGNISNEQESRCKDAEDSIQDSGKEETPMAPILPLLPNPKFQIRGRRQDSGLRQKTTSALA
jgi:hypothetical protein